MVHVILLAIPIRNVNASDLIFIESVLHILLPQWVIQQLTALSAN